MAAILSNNLMREMAAIETPCNEICLVDDESGLCAGCGRNLAEIERWAAYSDDQRSRIMSELPRRLEVIRARLGITTSS